MITENGITVDLDAIGEILERADVVTIGFSFIAQRLLLDLRANETEGPLTAVVDPVGGVQERYLWLGQHRSSFGAPQGFSFFHWPHSLGMIRELGLSRAIEGRLERLPHAVPGQLETAIAALAALEREATGAAIRGDNPWRTLWSHDAA